MAVITSNSCQILSTLWVSLLKNFRPRYFIAMTMKHFLLKTANFLCFQYPLKHYWHRRLDSWNRFSFPLKSFTFFIYKWFFFFIFLQFREKLCLQQLYLACNKIWSSDFNHNFFSFFFFWTKMHSKCIIIVVRYARIWFLARETHECHTTCYRLIPLCWPAIEIRKKMFCFFSGMYMYVQIVLYTSFFFLQLITSL